MQDLHDRVRQASSSVRSLNSTVIVQASQTEKSGLQTRRVANHNHCHALTILYEVLRHYRMSTRFSGRRDAVLIPFAPFPFSWQRALRFRTLLEQALLDPSLGSCFESLVRLYLVPEVYDAPPVKVVALPAVIKKKTVEVKGVLESGIGSGVVVTADDTISMNASGLMTFSRAGDVIHSSSSPDGVSTPADNSFIAPGLRQVSLIYKVAGGSWQQGGSFVSAKPGMAGELVFAINDQKDHFGDNFGHDGDFWTVELNYPSHDTDGSLPTDPAKDPAPNGYRKIDDQLCSARLLMHLQANQGFYNGAVWTLMDVVERRLYLEKALQDRPDVLAGIDDRPIAISGNYVAFEYRGPASQSTGASNGALDTPLEDIVTLPTRGLFAEAQMGHCNSCEERDVTRMWDWTQMTAETPPEIGGITPGPKGTAPSIEQGQLPGNVIQITQPQAAPDPTGLAAALRVLGTPDIFRDMSGFDEVSKLLETLSKESTEANIKAMALNAKDRLDQAKSGAGGTSNTGGTDKMRSSASESDAGKQVDRLKAIEYAKSKGLTGDQGAQDATTGVLGGEIVLASTTKPVEKMIGSGDVMLRGIDVSHHQLSIDWQKVKNDDVTFAFIKASEGKIEDDHFQSNWKESQDVGVIVGAYHYFRAGIAVDQQSDAFFKAVGTRHPPQLRPAVDVESIGNNLTALGITQAEFVVRLKKFCDAIEAFYDTRPIIYTNATEWKTLTDDSKEFADYPLWIANYARNNPGTGGVVDQPGNAIPNAPVEPLIPPAWHGGWYLWQYSYKGRVDGIVPLVDLDVFNGAFADLIRFAGFKINYV